MKMKELKELLSFGFKLQNAIMAIDGKVNVIMDAPKFLPALLAAPKAFSGINLIMAEIQAMTPEDGEELTAWVRKEFELDNKNIEELIEDTLMELVSLFKLAQRFAALRKK